MEHAAWFALYFLNQQPIIKKAPELSGAFFVLLYLVVIVVMVKLVELVNVCFPFCTADGVDFKYRISRMVVIN